MFGIDDAIAAVANVADSAIKRIWPDATEVEKLKLQQLAADVQAALQVQLGQLNINAIEAGNSSVFVSGWRPFTGWICGLSLAYVGLIEPLLRFISVVIFAYTGTFPVIDSNLIEFVLYGMLGLTGARTYEKYKGVGR